MTNHTYCELLVHLQSPAAPASREEARKLLAGALDGASVPPLLFNRTERGKTIADRLYEHGTPAPWKEGDLRGDKSEVAKEWALGVGVMPAVIVSGGQGGYVRLTGFGAAGIKAVMENAVTIADALSKKLSGCIYRSRLSRGEVGIDSNTKGGDLAYFCRHLFLSKKLYHYQDIAARHAARPPLSAVAPLVKHEIERGLLSQCLSLKHFNPEGKDLILDLPDPESLGIEILEGEVFYLPIEGKNKGLAIKNLVFTMNLNLTGPWHVGRMRSRGYGLIRRAYANKGVR